LYTERKGGIRGACENNCTDKVIHPATKLTPGINVQYKLESFGRRWSSNLHVELTIGVLCSGRACLLRRPRFVTMEEIMLRIMTVSMFYWSI